MYTSRSLVSPKKVYTSILSASLSWILEFHPFFLKLYTEKKSILHLIFLPVLVSFFLMTMHGSLPLRILKQTALPLQNHTPPKWMNLYSHQNFNIDGKFWSTFQVAVYYFNFHTTTFCPSRFKQSRIVSTNTRVTI